MGLPTAAIRRNTLPPRLLDTELVTHQQNMTLREILINTAERNLVQQWPAWAIANYNEKRVVWQVFNEGSDIYITCYDRTWYEENISEEKQ